MKTKLTIAKLVDKTATDLQKLVRLKAADAVGFCQCVSCGSRNHFTKMDGGHFFSRTHLRFKLFIENIHPQCKRCNMLMGDAKVHEGYRKYMIDMYGERRIQAMHRLLNWKKPKFKRVAVLEFRKDIKRQIKELENRYE